jgi:peptide/nickel transport system substrate-binding protein
MSSDIDSTLDEHRLTRRRLLECGAGAAGGAVIGGTLFASAAEALAAAQPNRGGTLKLAIGDVGSSDSLDPALQFTGIGLSSGAMVYDSLLEIDSAWRLTPALASDWDINRSATVWTFKLRRGVEFHSGKTLTSEDVAEQYRRVLNKKTGSGGRGLLGIVLAPAGISTPDERTIRFRLKQPDAFFGVKAAHYYTRIPQAGTTDWINGSPGTGPFKSVRFKVGEGYRVERNENYWQSRLPYLDAIECVALPESATRQQAVLNGDVDLSSNIPFSSFSAFAKSRTAALFRITESPFTFDVDGSIKPFSDVRVQQAMKMLIDRKKALEIIVSGYGEISADSLIAPSDPYYPNDLKPLPHDPEKAKFLLKQAGYPDGFKANIWTTAGYPLLNEGAAFGKQAFAEGGIDIEIQNVSTDRYLKAFLHEPIVMDYGLRQHPTVMFDLYYLSSSPQNLSRLKDAKIDRWIKELKATPSRTRQTAIGRAIVRRYTNVSAEIIPFHFFDYWPHKKRVKNLIAHPLSNVVYKKLWLS